MLTPVNPGLKLISFCSAIFISRDSKTLELLILWFYRLISKLIPSPKKKKKKRRTQVLHGSSGNYWKQFLTKVFTCCRGNLKFSDVLCGNIINYKFRGERHRSLTEKWRSLLGSYGSVLAKFVFNVESSLMQRMYLLYTMSCKPCASRSVEKWSHSNMIPMFFSDLW